jgi:hypothetical protein
LASFGLGTQARIIDIKGGDSQFVDHLIGVSRELEQKTPLSRLSQHHTLP